MGIGLTSLLEGLGLDVAAPEVAAAIEAYTVLSTLDSVLTGSTPASQILQAVGVAPLLKTVVSTGTSTPKTVKASHTKLQKKTHKKKAKKHRKS
jgi:hypothetical protein